jgi:SHS family lactate transporter-like MFS transporter
MPTSPPPPTDLPWWKQPSRAQWAAFLAAWSGWVLDAFDFTIFLLVMPYIAKDFDVGLTAAAGSITLTLLIRLLGGFAAGWAADRWGRKLPLMIAMVWFAICDGAVAFAPSFTWILILRTLFGFGMGAEWTAGATLAMESWPEKSRGVASGLLQGSWAIGYLLAAGVSALVVPAFGWRALFVIAAIPALLVLPIRMFVEESPSWTAEKAERERTGGKAGTTRELFAPDVLGKILWGTVVMGLGFGVYYAMSGVYPAMLANERHLGPGAVGLVLVVFNVGMLAGAIATGTIAQRKGLLFAVVAPALLMVPLLPLYVGMAPGLLYVGAFLGGALGVGFCGVVPALLTGMFDATVRARAVGVVYHGGALCAAFVPFGVASLAEHTDLGLAGSIALIAGIFELALAIAFLASRRTAAAASASPAPAAAH